MTFQHIQRVFLAFCLNLTLPVMAFAQDCVLPASVLIHSCQTDMIVRLRVLPDTTTLNRDALLTVAGTYSSGDRFGIEGLVIKGGKIVSRRYQNWDGVLIIDLEGRPRLYHATNVNLGDKRFNLKEKPLRDAFTAAALDAGITVLQSHLLITNGYLDLKDIQGAPKFKRRMFVTLADGSFAIWQSTGAETLFDAALQVQRELSPIMALNLDMGAYDYCVSGAADTQKDCGGLLVSKDKLTNLLEFTKG